MFASPLLAAGPGPSLVQVAGRQLIVQKRKPDGTLAPAAPYVIKGVVWSPASRNTNTSGIDANNATVRRPEFANWAAIDVPLLAGMGANTVRLLIDPGVDTTLGPAGLQILDDLYAHGIMAIMTVDDANNNTSRISAAVSFYKDHPAILMWLLGNEWNINRYYGTASSVADAAQRTQTAAALIKSIDTNHPVASSYGDIDIDGNGLRLADTQHYVNNVASSVDVWGLNIYRGSSFGALFTQWASISTKPMFLGEFGTDAFFSSCARSNPPDGTVDERTQKRWDLALWNEIVGNLSAVESDDVALGGTVFVLSDEWWKVQPWGSQQNSGFLLVGGHPDDFANEEYFGLTDIDRVPREAYHVLRRAFLAAPQPSPDLAISPSRIDFFALPEVLKTNIPAFLVTGTTLKGSQAFVNGVEIPVDAGGNFVTRYPLSGSQALAVGPNLIELRLVAPGGAETVTSKTIDYDPSLSTAEERLLYVDSVAPSLTGTLVINLDTRLFLGLLDQQHVRGIAPDGSSLYMASRAFVSTESHAVVGPPGGPLPFSADLLVNGFLVAPQGDYLYSRQEIVSRPANLLSPSSLPASILTGGASTSGGPAITPDGQFIYCGISSSSITKIDRVNMAANVIPTSGERPNIGDLSISPDGAMLARTSYGGAVSQVNFYEPNTLNLLGSASVFGDFSGEVVFSSQGECAIVGSSGNPLTRGGGLTSIDLTTFQRRSCSIIDLADNLAISSVNQVYASSGTRFGVDAFSAQGCGPLRRDGSYFLGINQFVAGIGIPRNNEIRRLVIKDLPTLSVDTAGHGGGAVLSTPPGIDCEIDCEEGYAQGTQVTLTPTPATGSNFIGWTGDPDCADGIVTMQGARSCVALFDVQKWALTMTRTGNGAGSVTSVPSGISCGADCAEVYSYGTQVTLTAAPEASSAFTGWSGDLDCADGVIVITADRACVAAFQPRDLFKDGFESGNTSAWSGTWPP